MPPPLAPQHYAQKFSQPRDSAFSTGLLVRLIRLAIYVAVFAVVAVGSWWYFTLQHYPQEQILWTTDGIKIHARVEGRTDSVFKYREELDGGEYYIPIAALSQWNQWLANLMPVNLSLDYPVDCTLRDQHGNAIVAKIEGRSNDTISFTVENKSTVFTYPLEKLSAQDRAWIQLLAVNKQDAPAPNPAAAPPPKPPLVKDLEDEIAQLQQDILNTQSWMTEPVISKLQKEVYQNRIRDETAQIDHLKKAIAAIQGGAQQ